MHKQKVNQKVFNIPKSILITGKLLQFFSTSLAARFVFKLFTTPYRFPRPQREVPFYQKAIKTNIFVSEINKKIKVYQLGEANQQVLLIHGWAGRGTQMFAIADYWVQKGFKVIAFDGPAHGESEGKTSAMPEFTVTILALQQKFGKFDFAVGHSLGGMALLNAVKQGFQVKKIALIASGNSVTAIANQFVSRLGLQPKVANQLKQKLDKRLGNDVETLSAYQVAKAVNIPVLVIHDENDDDVPVGCAHDIYNNLSQAKIHITSGLGHRKILHNQEVIETLFTFYNT